jgi:integrase
MGGFGSAWFLSARWLSVAETTAPPPAAFDIVTLKSLLGHAEITTTMIYLHIAQCPQVKPHSPLDTLYGWKKISQNWPM